MTARLKGRRRQAEALIDHVTRWAGGQPDVAGLALVGSYAYDRPGIGSDVDLVLLTDDPGKHVQDLGWVHPFDTRARLIRDQSWGSLRERRVRLRSGLQAELGVVAPTWAALPLDAGTEKVMRDGCRILHDPRRILHKAVASLA